MCVAVCFGVCLGRLTMVRRALADHRTEHRGAELRRRRRRAKHAEQFTAETDFVFRLMLRHRSAGRAPIRHG